MNFSGWLRFRRHLASAVVVLLGVGSLSLAVATAGQATGFAKAAPSKTRLAGFATARANVRVGGAVQDAVTVLPRSARTVIVQYRRAGTAGFTNQSTGRATRRGAITLVLRPPAAGRWQFRAVVAATKRAKNYTSPNRTVVAAGRVAATTISGFSTAAVTVKPGTTVSDDVAVAPRAARLVLVQARRPGSSSFVTQSSGITSRTGAFRAALQPTTQGVWTFRLVVPANPTAGSATSATRVITADDNPGTDTTAPRPVTGLTGSGITNRAITLSWTNPTDADFTGAVIRRALGSTAPTSPTAGSSVTDVRVPGKTFTDSGLAASTQYSYAVFAHDGRPNYASAATITLRTAAAPDATIPSPVSGFRTVTVGRTSISFSWTNPADADFTGVVIRRTEGGTPPATPTAGEAVADVTAPGTRVTDGGLVPGTRYSYAAFAHDATPNFSAPANLTVDTLPPITQAVLAIREPGRLDQPALTRLTVNTPYEFDGGGSVAVNGATLDSGSITYGDTSAPYNFLGAAGPYDLYTTLHSFTSTGPKTVTLSVKDSEGATSSTSTVVNVFAAPSAPTITPAGGVQVNVPTTFALSATPPADTLITGYRLVITPQVVVPLPAPPTVFEEARYVHHTGAPTAPESITFRKAGLYRVEFTFTDDAGGTSPITTINVSVAN